jgi:predicted enzyme related to lactoylglutathione lyase
MAGLLMNIKYVCLYVSDFDRAIAFYRDGLGLDVTYEEDGFAQFNTEGAILTVERGGEKSERPKDYHKNGILLQFEVEDLEKTVGTLKSRNVKFTQDITEMEFGHVAMIVDPDGNQLMLLEQ